MAETFPLKELPQRGKASAQRMKDGRIRLRGTHALALLRLIEAEATLEIRVSAAECDALRQWPLRRMQHWVASDAEQDWAQAAVDLLKNGPPTRHVAGWLVLLGLGIFLLTWLVLQQTYGGGL